MARFYESEDGWRTKAACRDTDPGLFFPVGSTGPAIQLIKNAKAVCRNCNVQIDCLEYAIATNQDSGIWGGTTEDERRQIRTTRKFGNQVITQPEAQ